MSLVIEALRRVEKTDARTGAIGAAVASYRPTPKPRSSTAPLLLGLLTGGALVLIFGAPGRNAANVSPPDRGVVASATQGLHLKGAAGLPPPMIIESALRASETRSTEAAVSRSTAAPAPPGPDRRGEALLRAAITPPPLVLQAISERDSHPIAIINDQLVREGEKFSAFRVLKIGTDSVEVVLENGKHETVRFALPPPPGPEPTPSPTH